jgi:deoxycytidine triphosphate deaminase
MLVVRSTLNRNGLFITSGLYDSFFKGNAGFCLHNRSPGVARIAPHTRVGQIMFVKSEFSGVQYSGTYNTKQGQHWADTKGE